MKFLRLRHCLQRNPIYSDQDSIHSSFVVLEFHLSTMIERERQRQTAHFIWKGSSVRWRIYFNHLKIYAIPAVRRLARANKVNRSFLQRRHCHFNNVVYVSFLRRLSQKFKYQHTFETWEMWRENRFNPGTGWLFLAIPCHFWNSTWCKYHLQKNQSGICLVSSPHTAPTNSRFCNVILKVCSWIVVIIKI